MGFTKKTWKNRIAEYINRRLITMEDGSTNLVTVARDEGTISQEGDAFNAANMNDLEDRIEAGFDEVNQSLINATDNIGGILKNTKLIPANLILEVTSANTAVASLDLNKHDFEAAVVEATLVHNGNYIDMTATSVSFEVVGKIIHVFAFNKNNDWTVGAHGGVSTMIYLI